MLTRIMLIILCGTWLPKLHAQDKPLAIADKKALMFQVEPSLNLSSLDGTLFTMKKQLTEKKAWRLSISLRGSHTEGETLVYEDSSVGTGNSDYSNAFVSMSFSYQHYINPEERVRFYYGYGAQLSYYHNWSNGPADYQNDQYEDRIMAGPIVYAGVEWFFTDRFSLSGEYGAYLYYAYGFSKYKGDDGHFTLDSHTIALSNQNARLGLSLYF